MEYDLKMETPSEEHVESDPIHDVLAPQEREKRRLANKPFIDHLDDAVLIKDGSHTLVQGKGMRLIIERTASVLAGRPWLDTRTYIILNINATTGELKLWDEELQHHAASNFITGLDLGYRFKIPARKGAPLPRRNKAAPKVKVDDTVKPTSKVDKETERRIYATRGIIHTRNKGIAYIPQGETKAKDGDRLLTLMVGTNLRIKNPVSGWEEIWVPNAEL